MKWRNRPLHVRREMVRVDGLRAPVRLMYASDLHLGFPWNRRIAEQLADVALDEKPDAVLLGGDLVDSDSGLCDLGDALQRLRGRCPAFAVAGNHDYRMGIHRVRDAVESAGGHWLKSASLGPVQLEAASEPMARAVGDYRVLVAHHPNEFDRAAAAEFDLVFAGHLHGGQCVLLSRGGRLYPGALFARYTGLRFQRGRTTMLVSRGAADTLPLRWNCPREVILCTLA